MKMVNDQLPGILVAVLESRQLDTMAVLLENRGADVLRVPLVAIHDAHNPAPVLAWIRAFCEQPPDLFMILTGEGVRRLLSLANRFGLRDHFVEALGSTTTLCRGQKPNVPCVRSGSKAICKPVHRPRRVSSRRWRTCQLKAGESRYRYNCMVRTPIHAW